MYLPVRPSRHATIETPARNNRNRNQSRGDHGLHRNPDHYPPLHAGQTNRTPSIFPNPPHPWVFGGTSIPHNPPDDFKPLLTHSSFWFPRTRLFCKYHHEWKPERHFQRSRVWRRIAPGIVTALCYGLCAGQWRQKSHTRGMWIRLGPCRCPCRQNWTHLDVPRGVGKQGAVGIAPLAKSNWISFSFTIPNNLRLPHWRMSTVGRFILQCNMPGHSRWKNVVSCLF